MLNPVTLVSLDALYVLHIEGKIRPATARDMPDGEPAYVGICSGRGPNFTLRICPTRLDDACEGIFADTEVAGNPLVAPSPVDELEQLRSEAA